jgi:Ca-activated chloride channel family protein
MIWKRRSGRKVMVVISDGGNTTSTMLIEKSLKAAQFADAVIYPVVVLPITNEAGRNTGGEHSLIFMAEGTGGRTFFPSYGKELDKAFATSSANCGRSISWRITLRTCR